MKFNIYFSFLCLFILAGCSSGSSQEIQYILNETLELSYEDIDNSLKKNRSKLLFDNGKVAKNCKSYFLLNSKNAVDESIHNQQVKSEYLICDALEILSNSSWEGKKKANSLHLGEQLQSKLDLRTFPSSLNRSSSKETHTLKSMFPGQTKFSDNLVELQTEDWAFTIEVVALARINDNSFPDWILWVLDESKSGNYRGYSTLVIYDPEKQKEFKGITYP
jgi:major membrane immunogen (membrane-anchored lipoprotein)